MRDLPRPGRYAMFLRKSREDIEAEREGKFETLAKHELQLSQLSASHGTNIVKVYRELVSGDSLAVRDACNDMLADVMAGAYDGVYAFDLQRLTRGDMIDQGTILKAFSITRTLIVTPDKVYDPSDMIDSDYMEMRLMFGRMELSQIKRRMVAGKENSVRQGQYIGSSPPYGWDKAVVGRKKTLVPNGDAGMVVGWYEAVAAGESTPGSIANDLNRRGVPSLRGGSWYAQTIAQVIKNPANMGYVRWNTRKKEKMFEDGVLVERRVLQPDGPMLCKAIWDGIVQEELWHAANAMISARLNTREKRSVELRNPLSGLLVCSKCGRPLRRQMRSGGKTEGYVHAKENREECWMVGASVDVVMSAVLEALAAVASDLEMQPIATDDRNRVWERRIEELEAQVAMEVKAVANLLRLAEKGMITDREFAERRRMSDARRETAESELEEVRESMRSGETRSERAASVRSAIAELADYKGRAKQVNKALKGVIRKIRYSKDSAGQISLVIDLR